MCEEIIIKKEPGKVLFLSVQVGQKPEKNLQESPNKTALMRTWTFENLNQQSIPTSNCAGAPRAHAILRAAGLDGRKPPKR